MKTTLNMTLILVAAVAMTACAAPGPAADAPTASVPEQAQAGAQKDIQFATREAMSSIEPIAEEEQPGYWDEEICRREPITGTRQTQRRCHTRWQWAQMESAATETMRDIWMQPRTIRD
jgi:hypothetical protein